MYTVLLSGGSGKRLWPLSNDLRSKQYLRLLPREDGGPPCSMVQRVWDQLAQAGLDQRLICASSGQVEILKSQLGPVPVAIEPDRRDTFPAVALSCAYIRSVLGGRDGDAVCVLPVDPYAEVGFFEAVRGLEAVLDRSGAQVVLLGARPDGPSEKYGYILPGERREGYWDVRGFVEKPDPAKARLLLDRGALWNCGVFCFRLGAMLERLAYYHAPSDYDRLFAQYECLPRVSFDYEVLEKADKLAAVAYGGPWCDLGTWSALTRRMGPASLGAARLEGCENTRVINELDVPVVALGTRNLVAVAAWDGILVADAAAADRVKEVLQTLQPKPRYEERRWGTVKTLDIAQNEEGFVLTRKLLMFAGQYSSYHFHREREEAVTILRGRGELQVEGLRTTVRQGSTVTIPRGKRHGFHAYEDLEFIEIHIGRTMGDEDINRLTFDWKRIPEIEGMEGGGIP